MERLFERVIENTGLPINAMSTMILSVPRPLNVDAIVVFPGLGEDWRLTDAISAWNKSNTAKYLLIGGIYKGEKSWTKTTIQSLSAKPFNLKKVEGVVIQPKANHTKDQVDWVVQQVKGKKIKSLALYISPYYLPRAYLTLLKAFLRADVPVVPIIPMPIVVSPDTIIPDLEVDGWSMIPGEEQRIDKYQELGDVATLDELKQYLAWFYKQQIITNK